MANVIVNEVFVSPNPVQFDQPIQVTASITNLGSAAVAAVSVEPLILNSAGVCLPATTRNSNDYPGIQAGSGGLPASSSQGSFGLNGTAILPVGYTVSFIVGTVIPVALSQGNPQSTIVEFFWITALFGWGDGTFSYPVAPAQVTIRKTDITNSGSPFTFANVGAQYSPAMLYNAYSSNGILNYDLSQPSNLMTWGI
jgi:hypothetical protein